MEQEKKVLRWGLKAVELTDQKEIQKALDEGYEPFSVITQFMAGKTLDNNGAPSVIPVNLMFFKQSFMMDIEPQVDAEKAE